MRLFFALFLIFFLFFPVSLAYVFESDECVTTSRIVDSCSGYDSCVTSTETYSSTCSKTECARTEFYQCNPHEVDSTCTERTCSTPSWDCNCVCSESNQVLRITSCNTETVCKTVSNCCDVLFWNTCSSFWCGSSHVCEDMTVCNAEWVDVCVEESCDTCYGSQVCENKDYSCKKTVYDSCSRCLEEKTSFYSCDKTRQISTAAVTSCENNNVVLSGLKFCQEVPCVEVGSLVSGKEYYLSFQVEKAYHSGSADLSVFVNGEEFYFASDDYKEVTGSFVFTAGSVENFEVVVIDNLDGDVSSVVVPVSLVPFQDSVVTSPFIPEVGRSELSSLLSDSNVSGFDSSGFIPLALLGLGAVSFAVLLSNPDSLSKVKRIVFGEAESADEVAADIGLSLMPGVGVLTDLRDFVRFLFGREDKLVGMFSLVGFLAEFSGPGDYLADSVRAFLKVNKSKSWYRFLSGLPAVQVKYVFDGLFLKLRNGLPLSRLDEYFESVSSLARRGGDNILKYASKLRARVIVNGGVSNSVLDKVLNFARSAEDFKYSKLKGFEGVEVSDFVVSSLGGGLHGKYVGGKVFLNSDYLSVLSDNELFSIVHHEYLHSFTEGYDSVIRELVGGNGFVVNEAHDLLTLRFSELVSDKERFGLLFDGYKSLLRRSDIIRLVDRLDLADFLSRSDFDELLGLMTTDLGKAKLAEWLVIEDKNIKSWERITKKLVEIGNDKLPEFSKLKSELFVLKDKYDEVYQNILK